jgi:hypothetical protein
MNLLKEIVYGKEGLAEREHKKHPSTIEHVTPTVGTVTEIQPSVQPIGQNLPESNVTLKETTTKLAKTHLEDVETAVEHIKSEEIREGFQTTVSTREPVSLVTVPKEAVIQEHIHPVEKIEVQPILHRQRQQMEVHQIMQPISEREVLPAVVQEVELSPQYIGDFVENDTASKELYVEGATKYESAVDVDGVRRIKVFKEPIVEETIRKTIIEEVQPVIHKETIAPVVIKETLPLYEKVVEAPVIVQEERSEVDMGTKLPEAIPIDAEMIHKLYTHQDDPKLVKVTHATVTTIDTKKVV